MVPVHNEASTLRGNVELLVSFLRDEFPSRAAVVIADNGSSDATWEIARSLAAEHADISALRVATKGRGGALRSAWLASRADVVSYMDVDLSTNLSCFRALVDPVLAGRSEIAIGTRLGQLSRVRRRLGREVLSRAYNGLVHLAFDVGFSDAQCGFKALRREVARLLVPLVRDDGWFFDTELLLLAERHGLRIHEVPVEWIEDLDSRVELLPTIASDLSGLWRMRQSFRGRTGESIESTKALGDPAPGREVGGEQSTKGGAEDEPSPEG